MPKKKVVVIGGGNGSALCLRALKQHTDRLDIVAVISMSDSGGSTGRLRAEFGLPPPGDILRATLALSPHPYTVLRQVFNRTRLTTGPLQGHSLGNLWLAWATKHTGDFMAALQGLHQAVEALGQALPVTLEPTDLCVALSSGVVVKTEAAVDRPAYDWSLRITKAWLEPAPAVYPPAAATIAQADYILLSPGSLYTSLVATLLPTGVSEAMAASRAPLIYIAGNAYQTNGETGPTSLSGAVQELSAYLPRPLNTVIYNNATLDSRQQMYYREKAWAALELDPERVVGPRVLGVDYEKLEGGLSKDKLAAILNNELR